MKYFKTKYGIIINENNDIVPMQEGNLLYNDYLQFLANEGVILETDYLTSLDLEIESNELKKDLTKEELIQKVENLQEELTEITEQLNNLL
jgi:predicted transcriptional regulator